jgi:hypothetical protein
MADMVLFCDLEVVAGDNGEQSMRRVIRTKPSLYYEAGDRTGRLPETLELDFGKFRESYNAATVAAPTVKVVEPSRPAQAPAKQ